MTVRAGIEIVACGSPPPGPGKVLGVAQGAERAGAAAGNLLSPTIPGGESFRSGWQSLLASLGSVVEGLSEEGGGAVDAALPAAQPAPGEAAGKGSVTAPDRLAGAGMRLSQGAEKGSGQPGAVEKLSPAGVRDGAFAHRPAAGAVLHASTKTEERKPTAELLAESAIGRSPAHSGKVARPEAAPVGKLPGPVPATIASIPQSLPAPALAKPVVRTMDAKAQFRQTDLSTSLPTGPLSTPIGPHRLNPYLPGGVAGPANAAVHESPQGTETPEKQGQLPPVPNLPGFSAAVLNQIGR